MCCNWANSSHIENVRRAEENSTQESLERIDVNKLQRIREILSPLTSTIFKPANCNLDSFPLHQKHS